MKKIMIDTNIYTSFKRNDTFLVEILRRAEFIGISIVVLGELLCGFKGGSKEHKNREELEQFLDSPRVHIIQMDEETAEYYAKIFWNLKRKGTPIPTNDTGWRHQQCNTARIFLPMTDILKVLTVFCFLFEGGICMATMTIRGIDDEVAKLLKERAKTEGISVNALLLKMVKESLGIEKRRRIKIYHDLDHLAGTWSEKDLKEFQKNVEDLERIDEEIWR